jgi:hypothetical protein
MGDLSRGQANRVTETGGVRRPFRPLSLFQTVRTTLFASGLNNWGRKPEFYHLYACFIADARRVGFDSRRSRGFVVEEANGL